MSAQVTGEVEAEDRVLILRRIHVKYTLKADPEHTETIERVHSMHHKFCPVYRSITPAIEITTELEIVPE